jgi:catechol 2,3-dioxygenase-like lactoylglutathione lyase family enzyme
MTVPDLDQAVAFFVAAMEAYELYRRELRPGTSPQEMRTNYGAHPDAGFRLAKLDIAGTPLEIFEYTAPDQSQRQPRNYDVGGSHLGFLVEDIDAAVETVQRQPGVRVLGEVSELPAGHPLAGRRWVYFLTPWGQQLELVSDERRTAALTTSPAVAASDAGHAQPQADTDS